jgi:hypothetical protein
VSVYYVNKFLYEVDRDPALLERYKSDPTALVSDWESQWGLCLGSGVTVERTTWLTFSEAERNALSDHDYVALFAMGAHFFLNLTIFIGIYEEDFERERGPLAFQLEMAEKLSAWRGRDYPSIAL